jgi:Cu(I)/Ag(I) efflux system membrane fusion protein
MNRNTFTFGAVAGAAGLVLGVLGTRVFAPAPAPTAVPTEAAAQPTAGAPAAGTFGQSLVNVVPVELQSIRDTLRINGKLALNGMRINQVSARLAGRIDRISVFEGASVKAGEPVGWLYSPEYISAQNEFLLARGAVRTLNNQATADLLEDAQATLAGARGKLKVLGASDADVEQLDRSGSVQQHLVVRAPISGRVIKRDIDPGGYLDTGGSLGTIADMSSLWFLGHVFEADLPRLREGQMVDIQVNGLAAGAPLRGRVSFISPSVDPQTHAVNIRVDLPNPNGALKPDMFARAEVAMQERSLPVVPRAAVVQDGAESFIIVQREAQRYERVSVEVAPANDAGHLAVTRGLQAGDRVVIEGSVLMDRGITNPQPGKPASNPLGTTRAGAGS